MHLSAQKFKLKKCKSTALDALQSREVRQPEN